MKECLFLAGLLDIQARDELLACAPDCIEAGGLVNLVALARSLAERVRALGEAQHLLSHTEVTALASALADATVTAARLVHTMAWRMREEETANADD